MNTLPADYRPLVRELFRRAAEHRQPVNGTFELSERCNLSCSMCYVRQSAGNRTLRDSELSAKEWLKLARVAVDNGMVFLLLTGGEVFLRRDFFEIYSPLTKMGLVITLFTNATLITDSIAKRLAEAPPSRTEVTLYGATAETYEAVTGIPGSYARCCAGIEALVKHQIPLGLKSTLTRHNVGELELMRQMAHDWGLPFSSSWLLSERRDGALSAVKSCRLTTEECVDLESADQTTSSEFSKKAIRESAPNHNNSFHCYAGQSSFFIDSQGKMNVCVDLPLPEAQPLDIGFQEAWSQVQHIVDSAPKLGEQCTACDARAYCPSCPAWSLQETGEMNKPVSYMCEVAKARKDRFFHSK